MNVVQSKYSLLPFAYNGQGSPNGVVKAPRGSEYLDLSTGTVYKKVSRGSTANGWANADQQKKVVFEDFAGTDTADTILSLVTASGAARATTGLHTTNTPGGNRFHHIAIATQTIAIGIIASGLDISGDATAADGWEVYTNQFQATGTPFVVGYDPAFYFECAIDQALQSGATSLLIGFRVAGAHAAAFGSYSDYAALGWAAALDLTIFKGVGGTDTTVDTTDNIVADDVYTARVEVSAAGVVTFKHATHATQEAKPIAPTVTSAITLPDGMMVIPFVHYINAGTGGVTAIRRWDVGFQD